ncbi:hypothetical protein BO78DRAFT_443290 [Aspergillus sclerotiicarbonarius CBS 121057]|uniref:Cupredoxin n=1 Tax=Aspergillus sclerotiicarbonarius (strain CBS 121057 / IBT 28362) TaxID=1448318 RepID=A0A319EL26_ASPSB|nr:hypothetical protein BO78DRAFT_443290 [Aspergillus sclerotiicarbonarius CBS 121057]
MLAFIPAISLLARRALGMNLQVDQTVRVDVGEAHIHGVYHIAVGTHNAPMFIPNRLNANIGDRIIFEFHNINHTLTQSTLEQPCVAAGGFDSGFGQFNPEDESGISITLSVNSLDPQWFFCKQDIPYSYCHAGMVFALNPGDKMNTFLDNAQRRSSARSTTDDQAANPSALPGAPAVGQVSAGSNSNPSDRPSPSPSPRKSLSPSSRLGPNINPSRSSYRSPSRSPSSSSIPSPSRTVTGSVTDISGGSNIHRSGSSASPNPTPGIVMEPVTVVTVTHTISCPASTSAVSIRRSVSPFNFTSEATGSMDISTMTPLFLVVSAMALIL